MAGVTPVLLDTSVFVHLVRDDEFGRRLKKELQLLLANPVPAFCVVSENDALFRISCKKLPHYLTWQSQNQS